MSTIAKTNQKSKWVVRSAAEVSYIIGIDRETLRKYIIRGCPGRPQYYPIPEIIAWCKENVWKARPLPVPTTTSPDEDSLMAGPVSPGLERYRMARAELEERKLAVARRELLPREEVDRILDAWVAEFRKFGALIQAQYPTVFVLFERCLVSLQQVAERLWDHVADGDETGADRGRESESP